MRAAKEQSDHKMFPLCGNYKHITNHARSIDRQTGRLTNLLLCKCSRKRLWNTLFPVGNGEVRGSYL